MRTHTDDFQTALLAGYRRAFEGFSVDGTLPTMNFSFQDLGLKLSATKTILNGVSGEIKAGRLTAVMGPSGAGKVISLFFCTIFDSSFTLPM